jgi:hypothetical protein
MLIKTVTLFGAFIVIGAVSIANALAKRTDLELVAETKDAQYYVSKSSINADPEELTVEFEFITQFKSVVPHKGKSVRAIVERTFILCRQRSYIVTEQLWFDDKDQPVGGARSSKHYTAKPNTIAGEMVNYVCGDPNLNQKQKPSNDLLI